MKKMQLFTFTSALVSTTYGLLPNINLNGKQLLGGFVYHLNCTTSLSALGCSVEFHVNDTTVDDIRFLDGKCVHKDGECQSNKCNCSNDCKIFQLNITTTTSNSLNNFGCGARIMVSESDANITYSARTTVKQDGEDFRMLEKMIFPVNIEKICSSATLAPTQGNGGCDSTFTTLFYVIEKILISKDLKRNISYLMETGKMRLPILSSFCIIGVLIFLRKYSGTCGSKPIIQDKIYVKKSASRSDSKVSSNSGSSTDTSFSLFI